MALDTEGRNFPRECVLDGLMEYICIKAQNLSKGMRTHLALVKSTLSLPPLARLKGGPHSWQGCHFPMIMILPASPTRCQEIRHKAEATMQMDTHLFLRYHQS